MYEFDEFEWRNAIWNDGWMMRTCVGGGGGTDENLNNNQERMMEEPKIERV